MQSRYHSPLYRSVSGAKCSLDGEDGWDTPSGPLNAAHESLGDGHGLGVYLEDSPGKLDSGESAPRPVPRDR